MLKRETTLGKTEALNKQAPNTYQHPHKSSFTYGTCVCVHTMYWLHKLSYTFPSPNTLNNVYSFLCSLK
jgi:hypothetical protein